MGENIPTNVEVQKDATTIAQSWLSQFAAATSSGNVEVTAALFLDTGWLRDILTFTWTHRSLCGREAISDYLSNRLKQTRIHNVKLDKDHGILPSFMPGEPMVEAALTFETPIAYGRGLVRLLPDPEDMYKALTVFLTLDDLKGHEEKRFESGYYNGHTKTWNEVYEEERARVEKDPHVIIVGAGQCGLNVGARFRQMNIPTLLIEKSDAVGDVWRKRYPTLTLHTNTTHVAPLYTRFATNAPKFTSRDKAATLLQRYAEDQNLVLWTRSTLLPTPSYDPSSMRWTATILRDGVEVTFHPYHIVLAIGTLGRCYVPNLPGQTEFKGDALHALDFRGGQLYTGKKAVVVGAGQSAADICQDLVARGAASVTMVQRSSTIVASSRYVDEKMDALWPHLGDTSVADFRMVSMPLGLVKLIHIGEKKSRVARQKEMLEGLSKAGLKIFEGPEGAGSIMSYYERFGGFWHDLGTADLIIQGKVKVKQGTEPDHYTPNELVFKDGSSLEADVIVFATGYEPIANTVREIFGDETARKITPIWRLDKEGENIRSYTPSGQCGLWWAIGDWMYPRYYSKSLALQIKARELGIVID